MRLYLDDDSAAVLLIRLLQRAGHDVLKPADIGQSGVHDPVHLRNAIDHQRTLLTGNNLDFDELHELIRAASGQHYGIVVVCKENDSKRDMTVPQIVRAIANYEASGLAVFNQLIILNHWR